MGILLIFVTVQMFKKSGLKTWLGIFCIRSYVAPTEFVKEKKKRINNNKLNNFRQKYSIIKLNKSYDLPTFPHPEKTCLFIENRFTFFFSPSPFIYFFAPVFSSFCFDRFFFLNESVK